MQPHQILFEAIFLGSIAYASWNGGRPERITAGIFFLAGTASLLALPQLRDRYRHLEAGVLLIDVLMLLGLILLWKTSTRRWPILMVAMQIVEILLHVARAMMPHIGPWAYQRAATFWSYPMLLLLMIATYRRPQHPTAVQS